MENLISENLSLCPWAGIGEITPDEWDLEMLDDIKQNPDCHEFISQEDLLKKLGLAL